MLCTPEQAQREYLDDCDKANEMEQLEEQYGEAIRDGEHDTELLEAIIEAKESDTVGSVIDALASNLAKRASNEDF